MLFNPGVSLAESNRVGLIAERLILEVPEVKVGRPAHRPRRTRRACRRRPFLRNRSRSEAVGAAQDRDRRRYPLAARGAAAVDQCRPADLAPARSHAVGRPRRDRAEDFRRRSRYAAQHGRRAARRSSRGISGPDRPAGREAGAHSRSSKSASTIGARRSTACSPPPWSSNSAGCRTGASSRASSTATAASTW